MYVCVCAFFLHTCVYKSFRFFGNGYKILQHTYIHIYSSRESSHKKLTECGQKGRPDNTSMSSGAIHSVVLAGKHAEPGPYSGFVQLNIIVRIVSEFT